MSVVEVDIVGPESLQRRLCRGRDTRRLQLLAALAGQHPDLGRDQHVVSTPAPLQPLAEQRLGLSALMPRHPGRIYVGRVDHRPACLRSEEHTSELQSLMRISYAVI